jgi:hypothetical protein
VDTIYSFYTLVNHMGVQAERTMAENTLTLVTLKKDTSPGLISLDSLALVTAQLPTSKRRHHITIVSCDPAPATDKITVSRDAAGVR